MMKLTSIFPAIVAILKAKLFGMSTPLAVTWQLTSQCNLRCRYCGVWNSPFAELSTLDITSTLEKLRAYGTQYISFTGGEPLLRDDIGEIIQFAVAKGFYVSVSTNGYLVPEKIEQLKGLTDVKMSFDGSKAIHDRVRGKGAFDNLMRAVECCQKNGINPSMQCVLSKGNLQEIDYILKIAKELKFKVMFQPATKDMLWTQDSNMEMPLISEYRKKINDLIKAKKIGAPIRNSMAGLKHLYCWPDNKSIYCSAGVLSCDLLPDGSLISCFRFNIVETKNNKREFLTAFRNIEKSPSCQQCWCGGLVEFNLMTSFNFQAITNWIKKF